MVFQPIDILKMESCVHMGPTANIIIKDIIHIFVSISKKHAYFADGRCCMLALVWNKGKIIGL